MCLDVHASCVYGCVLCLCLNFRRKKHPNSNTEVQRVRRFNLLAISGFRAQTVTQIRHLSCKIMHCEKIVAKIVVEVRVQGKFVKMVLIGVCILYLAFSPMNIYI